MITVRRAGIGVVVAAALVACAGDDDGQAGEDGPVPTTVAPQTVSSAEGRAVGTTVLPTESTILDPELRRELLEMMAEDQAEQTGQVSTNNYTARTERLAEILDEHGWPSHDLVGEDGSTAAWVIAQHADLDLELQQRALELLASLPRAGKRAQETWRTSRTALRSRPVSPSCTEHRWAVARTAHRSRRHRSPMRRRSTSAAPKPVFLRWRSTSRR